MKQLVCALAMCTSCATSQVFIGATEAATLQRALAGEERFLKIAFFSTPFFGDATKKLLSPVAPEQLRLLSNADGTPMNPGRTERVFGPGTVVRILKVEFPTAYVMSERVLYTPRSLAWVYLDIAGTPKGSPASILVLRPGLADENEVRTEIDRYLSKEDVTATMGTFSEPVRAAILEKRALVDMTSTALEMAWGYPETKKVELDGSVKQETWTWPDRTRVAVLRDGRVSELR
jgi:hypothetical protein